jgi:hypothetical protein
MGATFGPFLALLGPRVKGSLHHIPGLAIDDRFVDTFDLCSTTLADAEVGLVPEKVYIAAPSLEYPGGSVDLLVGCLLCLRLERLLHLGSQLRIGDPSTGDPRLSVSFEADLLLHQEVSSWWKSSWCESLLRQIVQSSLDISTQILEIALILPVDQGLHYQGTLSVGHIIGHGVKHIPAAPEVGLHELRIELISCQTGE